MSINFNCFKRNSNKTMKCVKGVTLTGILSLSLFLTGCNRTVFDTKYGFNQAAVMGDDSAIILDVEQWKDYSGEQIQLITSDKFVLLTSAFDTYCFYGNSSKYSSDMICDGAVLSEDIYRMTRDENNDVIFNKDLLDTNWSFNKSITFNGNKAVILPVGKWKDYSGEQLQVITKDGLKLVLSSYNSKLVSDSDSKIKAIDFAQNYVGSDGKVLDLAESVTTGFNYDIIDFNYDFNKVIIFKENSAVILPITEWTDYEGEQLQIKIKNGPTMVTAAYDTILINDNNSTTKANDIAAALSDNVIDLAGSYTDGAVFNKTIIDLNYGFSNAILSNDNNSSALKIDKWCDYEGEQLQIKLPTGDVILTSSLMLDLINGGTSELNASSISKMYIDESGTNIDKSNSNISSSTYNKYLLDTDQKFKYALKVVDGNVTIIPLKKWTDYYNSDGGEDIPDSPNCEQVQLIMPDGTVLVTTMYDTLLVDNVTDIKELAKLVCGPNGIISDLTPFVGEPNVSGWNFTIFDTKYSFNYAIINNGETSQLLPIKNWLDFSEGEQLQINFFDDTGILTSYVNTTLVYSKNNNIQETIAKAFSGELENEKGKVLIYK